MANSGNDQHHSVKRNDTVVSNPKLFSSPDSTIYVGVIGLFGAASPFFLKESFDRVRVSFLSDSSIILQFFFSSLYAGIGQFWGMTAFGLTVVGKCLSAGIYFAILGALSYVLCRRWTGRYVFLISSIVFLVLNAIVSASLLAFNIGRGVPYA